MSYSKHERRVANRRTKHSLTTDERIHLLELEIDKLTRDVQSYKDWNASKGGSYEDETIDNVSLGRCKQGL